MSMLNDNNYIELRKAVLAIFLVILLFFCIKLVHYHYKIMTDPFPIEYREGAMILTTDLMLKGGNPFALANQPQYTNVYGVFYHIIVYPVAKVFGPGLTVHRAVVAFFIIASCLLLFLVLRREKAAPLFAFCAALIFYASLLFHTTPPARPDSLGLFLFLGTIFVPLFYRYSLLSMAVSIICGILSFYTKTYFVLGIPYLTCYIFLFISKKKGMLYIALFLVLLFCTVCIVNYFFECYFSNTFFSHINITKFENAKYTITQFKYYLRSNRGLFIILALALLSQFIKNFRKIKENLSNFRQFMNRIISKIDFFNINKPLVNINFDSILFCLLCSLSVVYFKLGRNEGAVLTYFFHLISPFLLIVVFRHVKMQSKWQMIFIPLIIMNLWQCTSSWYLPKLVHDLESWGNIKKLVSEHQNILNSPVIVPMLVEQNKEVYDSGSSEYFKYGADRGSIFKLIFSPDDRVTNRYKQFLEEIRKSVIDKRFDLILLTDMESPYISKEGISRYYKYMGPVWVSMPHAAQQWKLDIWMPK